MNKEKIKKNIICSAIISVFVFTGVLQLFTGLYITFIANMILIGFLIGVVFLGPRLGLTNFKVIVPIFIFLGLSAFVLHVYESSIKPTPENIYRIYTFVFLAVLLITDLICRRIDKMK